MNADGLDDIIISAPNNDEGKGSGDFDPEQDDKRSEDTSKENDDEGTSLSDSVEFSSQSGRGNGDGKEEDEEDLVSTLSSACVDVVSWSCVVSSSSARLTT